MNNYLLWENTNRNETFSDFVCLKIRERQLNEVALYKSVDLSRDIFSKMFSNRFYRPSKQTAIKFCLGLKLRLVFFCIKIFQNALFKPFSRLENFV